MIGMRWRASVLATLVGSLAVAATGRAADQLVLGDAFVLANPGGPALRTAAATADERNAAATIVGDPTLAGSAGGAILTLFANGASSSSQSFVLPQGTSSRGRLFWRTMDAGFRYDDVDGEQGPVTAVRFKRTSGGRFTIDSAVLGLNGPVEVVPPNPGTDAFMTLKLGLAPEAGDRYCVQYGPESDITNDGPFFFSAKNPVEKGCPTTTSTTTTTTTTTTPTTTTIPDGPCADDQYPACGGACPSGEVCLPLDLVAGDLSDTRCRCIVQGEVCGGSVGGDVCLPAPLCILPLIEAALRALGGTCPLGQVCLVDFTGSGCNSVACGVVASAACP
jgi:hypothetical protein